MLGAAHTEAAPSVIFDILDHLMNVVVEAGGLELGLSSLKEYLVWALPFPSGECLYWHPRPPH